MHKQLFVFPGQASQYVGMGKQFYEKHDVVKDIFNQAEETVGIDVYDLCLNSTMEQLTKTHNAQIAIYTLSVAMFKYLEEKDVINPDYLAGHSLGEISALVCSGAIDFVDGLKIVKKRGELMHAASSNNLGGMLSVSGKNSKTIDSFVQMFKKIYKTVNVSCYNTCSQVTLSGSHEDLEAIAAEFKKIGAQTRTLNVSAPFHNHLMADVAEAFEEELKKYAFNDFKIPVISNIDCKAYGSKDEIVHRLKQQITEPVQWNGIMNLAEEKGMDLVVEIGPKAVLTNFFRANHPKEFALAMDNRMDYESLKMKLDLKERSENGETDAIDYVKTCIHMAICAQNHSKDTLNPVVTEKIRDLKTLHNDIETGKVQLDDAGYKNCLASLMAVLNEKQTNPLEKVWRLKRLYTKTLNKSVRTEILQFANTIHQ